MLSKAIHEMFGLKILKLKNINLRAESVQSLMYGIEELKYLYELNLSENKIALNIEITEGRTGLKYFFITDPDKIFVEIVEDKRNL